MKCPDRALQRPFTDLSASVIALEWSISPQRLLAVAPNYDLALSAAPGQPCTPRRRPADEPRPGDPRGRAPAAKPPVIPAEAPEGDQDERCQGEGAVQEEQRAAEEGGCPEHPGERVEAPVRREERRERQARAEQLQDDGSDRGPEARGRQRRGERRGPGSPPAPPRPAPRPTATRTPGAEATPRPARPVRGVPPVPTPPQPSPGATEEGGGPRARAPPGSPRPPPGAPRAPAGPG